MKLNHQSIPALLLTASIAAGCHSGDNHESGGIDSAWLAPSGVVVATRLTTDLRTYAGESHRDICQQAEIDCTELPDNGELIYEKTYRAIIASCILDAGENRLATRNELTAVSEELKRIDANDRWQAPSTLLKIFMVEYTRDSDGNFDDLLSSRTVDNVACFQEQFIEADDLQLHIGDIYEQP